MKKENVKTKTKATEPKRILICSSAGKQGKSTMAKHLFPGYSVVSWDGVNADDLGTIPTRVKNEAEFIQSILSVQNDTVFDIGASQWLNMTGLFKESNQLKDLIDTVLLVAKEDALQDAQSSVESLTKVMGFNVDKIHFLLNSVRQPTPFETKTAQDTMWGKLASAGFTLNKNNVIPFSAVITEIKDEPETLQEIANSAELLIKNSIGKNDPDVGRKILLATKAKHLWTHFERIRESLGVS